MTDFNAVRNRDRVLAAAGLTIAATLAALEAGDLDAYLVSVPLLAALPTWLA